MATFNVAKAVHTHVSADITDLQSKLDAKADDSDLTTKMDQEVATGHEARFRGVYAAEADLDGLTDAQDNDWAIVPTGA